MYKLFYSPGSCSMAVHVCLNEMGQDVELKRAIIGDPANIDAELHKYNPRNQVPVLLEDSKVLLEGAAIITYLCDKHHSALLPASGWERAQALQWLMFGNSSLHVAYSRCKFIMVNGGSPEMIEKSCAHIQSMWDSVEGHLKDNNKPYVAGDTVTAGDILLTVIANWGFLGRSFNFGPKTKALLKSVSNRPAYQKAMQVEGVEYKAAA